MSISLLQATANGTKRAYDQVRNRAMDLCAGQMTTRGDNLRLMLLSDLKFFEIPVAGAEAIPSLVGVSDNGKSNKNGRVDHVAMIRHKDVAVCDVGAVALYFFGKCEVKQCLQTLQHARQLPLEQEWITAH